MDLLMEQAHIITPYTCISTENFFNYIQYFIPLCADVICSCEFATMCFPSCYFRSRFFHFYFVWSLVIDFLLNELFQQNNAYCAMCCLQHGNGDQKKKRKKMFFFCRKGTYKRVFAVVDVESPKSKSKSNKADGCTPLKFKIQPISFRI